MDEFICPKCQSEDVSGERRSDGAILLTCASCQATWPRVPKSSCPRCGSGDIEEYGREAFVYDNATESADGAAGTWTSTEARTLRCRKCRHTWGSQ